MDKIVDEASTAAYKRINIQWDIHKCRIQSLNSTKNHGHMQIKNGEISCDGDKNAKETLFNYYRGYLKSNLGIFECIGDEPYRWVVCVDSSTNKLTARKSTKKYVNFSDAEDDILFTMEILVSSPSHCRFKWKKGGIYMGFDVDGQPIPLDKVDKSKDEAKFQLVHLRGKL